VFTKKCSFLEYLQAKTRFHFFDSSPTRIQDLFLVFLHTHTHTHTLVVYAVYAVQNTSNCIPQKSLRLTYYQDVCMFFKIACVLDALSNDSFPCVSNIHDIFFCAKNITLATQELRISCSRNRNQIFVCSTRAQVRECTYNKMTHHYMHMHIHTHTHTHIPPLHSFIVSISKVPKYNKT